VKEISIVIPVRQGGNPRTTLESLSRQSLQSFDVIVSWDKKANADWARNQGFSLVKTPYVLFSDDDIKWEPDALEYLHRTLSEHPEASYAYGSYFMPGIGEQCNVAFDNDRLRKRNLASTMSLLRTADFIGFDESIQRGQDYDLWLGLLALGKIGIYCGQHIFTTEKRDGITYGTGVSWEEATRPVRVKHGLI